MPRPCKPWNTKRIAALCLAILLGCLGVVMAFQPGIERKYLVVVGIGSVLGLIYAFLGRLPDAIIQASEGKLTHDEDERNVRPQIYLPIIMAALVGGAVCLWIAFKR